jgi:hypothetical protein
MEKVETSQYAFSILTGGGLTNLITPRFVLKPLYEL